MAQRTVQAKLQGFYWRAERRIAPGLEYSQHQYERELRGMVSQGARWLDLGCGHRLLPEWRGDEESSLVAKADQIVGLDPDFHSLRKHRSIKQRVLGDASHLPFRDGAFDLVTANMVVEHLPAPVEQFGEVYRVLDSGGRFVFHTPNLYGHATALARLVPESLKGTLVRVLDGRAEEDRFRTYYQCNTRAAVVAIAERAGFHLESIDFLASSAAFALIPPLALLELGWIRLTMRRFPGLRATLLVTLVRPPA